MFFPSPDPSVVLEAYAVPAGPGRPPSLMLSVRSSGGRLAGARLRWDGGVLWSLLGSAGTWEDLLGRALADVRPGVLLSGYVVRRWLGDGVVRALSDPGGLLASLLVMES